MNQKTIIFCRKALRQGLGYFKNELKIFFYPYLYKYGVGMDWINV